MKKRNLLIISAVVVLGIVTFAVVKVNSRSATFKQDYHITDPNTITRIFMADKENQQVLLTRNEGGTGDSAWMVDNTFFASGAKVDLLLVTLHEMRIRQQVNKAAAANVVKALSAHSIKVEVYQTRYFVNWFRGRFRLFPHEKLTVTYYIGHETQDMMGTNAFREGDKLPVILHIPGFRGFLSPRFITDPLLWRSHRVVDLPVQQIESVQIQIPAMPQESFAIVRDGEGFRFQMLQSKQFVAGFDTARVAQMLSSFVNLNFDEYAKAVPQVELDSTFSKAPRTILTVTDVNGKSRELKTYIKYTNPQDAITMPDTSMYNVFDLNRLYAVLDNKDTVLIQYYVFDNILQPASFFLGQGGMNIAK